MLEPFLDLLKTNGFWVAFLWSTIDTDFIFVLIGAFGHSGHLPIETCLPAALLGALLHDIVIFQLVRSRADWVRSRRTYQKIGPRVEQLARKLGPWQLAACRPLYGSRYPSLTFWGLQKLSFAKFLLANIAGLFPWGTFLTCLGYFGWDQLEALKSRIVHFQQLLAALVLLGIVVAITLSSLRKRRTAIPPQKQPQDAP